MIGCVWVKDTMLFHGADTDNAPRLDRIRMTISHHSDYSAMLCFRIAPTLPVPDSNDCRSGKVVNEAQSELPVPKS
jgi:hypothetical protein